MNKTSVIHSTISDGNMSFLFGKKTQVQQNRIKFFQKNFLDPTNSVAMKCNHGCEIENVDSRSAGFGILDQETAINADALITEDNKISLFLLTADCLPISIFDKEKNIICLAHLSRYNSSNGFIGKIIKFLVDKYNANIQGLEVNIGPCIHKESYECDLVGLNMNQLLNLGLSEKNIYTNPIDTFTNRDYFSHRRSLLLKKSGEIEGRFATIIFKKIKQKIICID